jgi:tight adherence protein B
MSVEPLAVSLLVGTVVAAVIAWAAEDDSAPGRLWRYYHGWWIAKLNSLNVHPTFQTVPLWQSVALPALIGVAVFMNQPLVLALAAAVIVLPPWLLIRHRLKHQQVLNQGLDAFLTILADSLATVPNLTEALSTVLDHVGQPIKNEVISVLKEMRLGASLEHALSNMAKRVRLPGFDAAVGAALLGKRTGGDLPGIFRRIAAAVREMARLEGVIRTKTAEGRCQAWVMGSVPPGLLFILEYVDPNWIAPLWRDPIGWALIGLAAVLEVTAIALIRKIMAVVI